MIVSARRSRPASRQCILILYKTMHILLYGSLSFFCALLVHFSVWKIYLPRRQLDFLLKFFLLFLVFCIIVLKFTPKFSLFGIDAPQNIFDYLSFCLFYISAMLSYIISYSALEADSPSMVIVLKVEKAGRAGIAIEELERDMTNETLLLPRIKDLERDGLAVLKNNRYRITSKGRCFISLFIFFRRFLGESKGG